MKTIIFDFDGTLHQSSNIWRTLWHKLGYQTHRYSAYRELIDSYRNGLITREERNQISCKAFRRKGLSRKKLWEYAKDITLLDGAQETFKALKARGCKMYIVSGNIDDVINITLGENRKYFDGIFANKFIYDSHGYLKDINGTKYDYQGKTRFIEEYKAKTGSKPEDIIFIGDDDDDLAHFSGCHTICFNPHQEAEFDNQTKWHRVVRSDNLQSLIPEIDDIFDEDGKSI